MSRCRNSWDCRCSWHNFLDGAFYSSLNSISAFFGSGFYCGLGIGSGFFSSSFYRSFRISSGLFSSSFFSGSGFFSSFSFGGGSFFNEDRTACNLDSPESIDGIKYYQNLYGNNYGVAFGEDPEPVYKSGKLGMFINGRWATPGSREITDFNWDVAPLPTGAAPGKDWLFWGAYVINAKTADPAAAWKLVAELTSLEVQDKVASLGANIPSRTSQDAIDAFLTYTPPENNQAFINGLHPIGTGEDHPVEFIQFS